MAINFMDRYGSNKYAKGRILQLIDRVSFYTQPLKIKSKVQI